IRDRNVTGVQTCALPIYPQAFHCTGLPILGAAKRIAEKEPKQWEILRAVGIPDREIPKFADPMHWIDVFPAATMEDLKALGAARSEERRVGKECAALRAW